MLSIFGDPNKRFITKIQPLVDQINAHEKNILPLTDAELKGKTDFFKEQLKNGKILDDILPQAFACVREAAKRTLKQRHFDCQLVGGIVLHQGKISEMKTGEGKTLAATLPAYLNALDGKGVHVVTVNDYLSRRDAVWMGQIYYFLGLSVACLNHEQAFMYDPTYKTQGGVEAQSEDEERDKLGSFKGFEDFLRPVERREAYAADILYGTNNEFGFDYLRDNLVYEATSKSQRGHNYAIVDEIDSILIDEARTPLIISVADEDSTRMYLDFARIVPMLKENTDYNVDEKLKAVSLTQQGIDTVEKTLGMTDMYSVQNLRILHHLEQALRAQILFRRDKEYVVRDGEVVIVDDFTGRLMPGRRYSDGLHQAIEAKENVEVKKESRTMASITFQNYFRMYTKLSGMTGTAQTSAEEFAEVYKLEVVSVPSNKVMARKDFPDVIYKSEDAKFKAVAERIKECNLNGQPVLVGTISIEKNERLSAILKREGVAHQILNAKNHEQEGEIIAQAGKYGAVTVATNMAGRGVDIILGGTPMDPEQAKRVAEAGGLHVIGTERHESRRIDNQLRGRGGRQGDPGTTQFFVSLEDDLMRIFGSDKIKSIMEAFNVPEDQPIETKMVSRAIESAQAKIEGMNFDTRKYVLEYDEVLNKQRKVIYGMRDEMLATEPEKLEALKIKSSEALRNHILHIIDFHTQDPDSASWGIEELMEIINTMTPYPVEKLHEALMTFRDEKAKGNEEKKAALSEYIMNIIDEHYKKKEAEIGEAGMREAERSMFLRIIDIYWMEHLENMDHLKNAVRLQAWGQKDPLVEYKNQGHQMFKELLGTIQEAFANSILKVVPASKQQQDAQPVKIKTGGANIGRNDECPCGSGKKFKKCHGK
jgi:preprotein translocase subunit SecA